MVRPLHFSPCSKQYLDLPYSMISYICRNPTTPSYLSKLQKTCKFFFFHNPIILTSGFYGTGDGSRIYARPLNDDIFEFLEHNLLKPKVLYWMTKVLVYNPNPVDFSLNQLIGKIYRCDLRSLRLMNVELTLEEFEFITRGKALTGIGLFDAHIYDAAGSEIDFHTLLSDLPHIKGMEYSNSHKKFKSKFFDDLHFEDKLNASTIYIHQFDPFFDPRSYYNHVLRNVASRCLLFLLPTVPETCLQALLSCREEILNNWNPPQPYPSQLFIVHRAEKITSKCLQ